MKASDQAWFLWAHNNAGFRPAMLASGPLDLCPALACSSHHRKWDLLVALPSGRSPGQAPVSSLLQEVSSRRNASSPKYSDAQDLYIVLGSPEPISEKRL